MPKGKPNILGIWGDDIGMGLWAEPFTTLRLQKIYNLFQYPQMVHGAMAHRAK
ncbi:hypothetical protein [Novosphingobium panipatense]|uniref:Uncharacterized protein n=1 Tax=Novosphingobium panipatense TaxID=428991 RepID=A0ABY1Q756_9SPHN|nr:hypothetical protein [Novosphingobium panipatense]SMP61476.1 hypothetical protein SAMN06296065_103267 [Novosphingobium panipatense]